MPFGQLRTDIINKAQVAPTDFGYTGQRSMDSIGLMDYNARFYDPYAYFCGTRMTIIIMSNITSQKKKIVGVFMAVVLVFIFGVMFKIGIPQMPINENPTLTLRPTITPFPFANGDDGPTSIPWPTSSAPFNNILTKTAPMKGEKIVGKIFMREMHPYGVYNLVLLDSILGNARVIRKNITGSPDISLDGKMLVVGCSDATKLCIFDLDNLVKHDDEKTENTEIHPMEEFKLPTSCLVKETWGIQSLSWARDGKKIAVVCGDRKQSNVFILDKTKGVFYEWKKVGFPGQVRRIAWSPIKDILAISFVAEGIYLTDAEGIQLTFLSDGESPSWSPDGNHILYFRFDKEKEYFGIAMMSADGSNQIWLHRPVARGSREEYEDVIPACNDVSAGCRLSWSLDGNYAVFSSIQGGPYDVSVFRINLKTSEIIFVTDPYFKYGAQSPYYTEPVWAP